MTRRRRISWRVVAILAATAVLLGAASAALYRWPDVLFAHRVQFSALTLWSDVPFAADDGHAVLEKASEKLARCPLFDASRPHSVFICNAAWRRRFFFLPAPGAGGASYDGFPNVFLSGARVAENQLVSPSGRVASGDRTLDHMIVHELVHHLTWRANHWLDYRRMPDWVREGYAEYVARGNILERPGAIEAFLSDAKEMNSPRRAPYLRYNLLVAHLVETRHWTLEELFSCRLSLAEADAMVRADLTEHRSGETPGH